MDSRWPDLVHGQVHATKHPTCHASTYDFFVVSAGISAAVVGTQVLDDAGLSPHHPCRLIIRGDARRHAVRRLVKPMHISGVLPFGPAPLPPCYADVHEACKDDQLSDGAMNLWYVKARQEWAAITGAPDRARKTRFVWSPVAGKCASPFTGATTPSITWRILARRADDVSRLINANSNGAPGAAGREVAVSSQTASAAGARLSLSRSWRQTHPG